MPYKKTPIITIDGPGGTGKGTVGRRLAHHLGWHFLDSGMIYRGLAFAALKKQIAHDDERRLEECARTLDLHCVNEDCDRDLHIFLEDEEIGEQLRSETIGSLASKISTFPTVRSALLEWQRAFAKAPGLVTDGRDMGTVVFPDADLKLFLDASCEERAHRRFLQLQRKGIDVDLVTLTKELQDRDRRDRERAVAPLRAAPDALIIDTTHLTVEAVLKLILVEVGKRSLNAF